MYQSPRIRRLHNDLAALARLRSESSVFRYSATGDPPHQYHILFHGKGLCRDRSKVKNIDHHRVEIKLGASYPRGMPEIRWVTPIYHPNISEIGMVCLGGYGTHWVPSVQLDELCVMLWDMVRYHNYDIRSPYNREAALWVAGQTTFRFPTDARPLRDLRAFQGRVASAGEQAASDSKSSRAGVKRAKRSSSSRPTTDSTTPVSRVLQFIERYGRVFGNGAAPGSERGNANLEPERSRPELAYIRQFIARSDGPSTDPVVPEPVHGDTNTETPASIPEADAHATTLADTNQGGPYGQQDDVIILEASSDDPEPETTQPRGEEIIFIE